MADGITGRRGSEPYRNLSREQPQPLTGPAATAKWRSRLKRKQGAEVSTQDGGLSRREHQRQFVAESLTLSLNDSAAFLYLFRAIDCLDRLPPCNMQVLARAEHPVQHAAYSAQRLSAFLTKNGAGIENTGRFFVARSHRQHHLVSASPAQNLHRQDWPGRVARAARVIPPPRPAPA